MPLPMAGGGPGAAALTHMLGRGPERGPRGRGPGAASVAGAPRGGGRQRAPPFIDLGRYTPETTTTSTRIAHSVVGE